jgi:hypothetical protein
MMDSDAASQSSNIEEAAHFAKHPGCRAIVIPLWMVEKISVDFTDTPDGMCVIIQLTSQEKTIEGS